MPHVLPPLPYAFDALEPQLDARTVEIHHDRHHATYVNNLNAALEKAPALQSKSLVELLGDLNAVPAEIRTAVRNNGGGTLNHNLYWEIMTGGATGQKPTGPLVTAMEKSFGGFDAFKEKFSKTAVGQFASGWAFLFVKADKSLTIASLPGHDSPVMKGVVSETGAPILIVDVWEHAYYLKFQNKRADFVSAWWNVVNWRKVEELYAIAQG